MGLKLACSDISGWQAEAENLISKSGFLTGKASLAALGINTFSATNYAWSMDIR